MANYYVNNKAQANSGDHEVHKDSCAKLPSDRTYLGNFTSCTEAVRKAKEIYAKSDGCSWCSGECHTG